ncbi:hypothetical protein SAMN05216188_110115 [Lentzea xinjiangensis]|uniref:Uncharacterized protein n=2 Tax=Lentzea xinjiangensis TaxID=402600 RepID=A0A1H9NBC4_9PSEU|nr:hypothetical protein SAMN05216188_110115 [Lentzea xinjiangensis]
MTRKDMARGKPGCEGYLRGAAALGLPISECAVFEGGIIGVSAGLAANPAHLIGVGIAALRTAAPVVVRDMRGIRWTGGGLHLPYILRRSSVASQAGKGSI